MNMMDGVSGLVGGTVLTAIAAVTLDGSSVSIELAGGLFMTGGGIVWWMSSKFTKLSDNITSLREDVSEMKKVLRNCPAAKTVDMDDCREAQD